MEDVKTLNEETKEAEVEEVTESVEESAPAAEATEEAAEVAQVKELQLVEGTVLEVTPAEAEKVNVEDYNTMNLVDTLAEEEIEFKTDYKETDDQVVIYLFRGKGCGYCRAFLTYLSKLDAEKLNKIKVVGFESWYDEANYNLLNEIGKSLGQEASGVPYIIIGDQVFPGYADTYDADIEAKINELYAQKPGNRYDVFEEHNKALAAAARDEIINKYPNEEKLEIIASLTVLILSISDCPETRKSAMSTKL